MKRLSIFWALIILASSSSAFSIKEWKNTTYEQVRLEAVKGLETLLNKKVAVGQAEGILVGQIVLRELSVPEVGQAEKMVINFNPLIYLYKKDIVPAISSIIIENGDFEVARNQHDQWNILSLLPKAKPGTPPALPFKADIAFVNCRINYRDALGFRTRTSDFKEHFFEINGKVSLKKTDKISFKFSAKILKETTPSPIKVFGSVNLKTNNFEIKINAQKIDLKKWGNYSVPLDLLIFSSGEADLALKITPPKTKGWSVSLSGNFYFENGSGRFGDYKIENISGNLSMADDSLLAKNLSACLSGLPLTLNGKFHDFTKLNLDLDAALPNAELKKLASLFPQAKHLDLKGPCQGNLKLQGTVPKPILDGSLTVKNGLFYNQSFSGHALLSLKQDFLKIDIPELHTHQGKVTGILKIDLKKQIPLLSLRAKLNNINLASLSQSAPGIAGAANGELLLSGPLDNLSGSILANLAQASILGQELQKISSSFRFKDGNVYIDNFSASSKSASILSSGKISRDLSFDFFTKAEGVRLKGKGWLGKMEATVDFFQGNVNWILDHKFLASPLKNLNASGEATLGQGQLGEQFFDSAHGKINMGKGLIRVEEVVFKNHLSVLNVSGQTGIGFPTHLEVYGEKINLLDLKILNHFLPQEAQNPSGYTDINLVVSGTLPKETHITSLDPLLGLNVNGTINLFNVNVAEIPIAEGKLILKWEDQKLSLSDGFLKMPDSSLAFNLDHKKDGKIKGQLSGFVDLYHFRKLTGKHGKLSGNLGINLIAEGSLQNPAFSTSFQFENLNFNQISFDKISGSLTFLENKLSFSKPLFLSKGLSQYEISGIANLEALLHNQAEESYLDLNLKIPKADLSSVINLFNQLQNEFSQNLSVSLPKSKKTIVFSPFLPPRIDNFSRDDRVIYFRKDGSQKYFLESWNNAIKELTKEEEILPEENFGGQLSGHAYLKGKFKNLSGEFSAQIRNGHYKNFTFNNLTAIASLSDQKIKIEQLKLSKAGGELKTEGEYGLDGKLSLLMTAKNMPLETLKIVFDKNFQGNFNMQASIEGTLKNPVVLVSASGSNLELADSHFDRIVLAAERNNNHIFIRDISLLENKSLSRIAGEIDLAAGGKIDLSIELKNNACGLLNLFTEEVRWIKGAAFLPLRVTGDLEKPDIHGKLFLKNSILYVKAINSEVGAIEGEIQIEKSLLKIKKLAGFWQGKSSKNHLNPLSLSGTIDLEHVLSEHKMATLDLVLDPCHLFVDLPNLYSGELTIKEAKLSGPFYFDLSAGPELSGKAEVNNAVISISKSDANKGKKAPLNFNLAVDLSKNVYAVMGDVMTLDLSNMVMNVEIKCDDLKISGNLQAPSLLGKVLVKRGSVTILNREFTLLSIENQKSYFPYDSSKIRENTASFSKEEGAMPDLTLTAKVDVENLEKNTQTGITEKKKVVILSFLQGIMGAQDKARGLKTTFYAFTENKTKSPPQMEPASYSEQDIKVMLLPDFIKSLTGISGGQETGVDTNAVVADYLSSRLQTLVFRGLERNLEQRLGLESLTLEYNFGKKLRQEMGIKDTSIFGQQPDWRVGFVKGFFDKFYVDVRYSEMIVEGASAAQTSFIYQLTYKLSPIWSIMYYREPPSIGDFIAGYQKVTLQAGLSFW